LVSLRGGKIQDGEKKKRGQGHWNPALLLRSQNLNRSGSWGRERATYPANCVVAVFGAAVPSFEKVS